MRLADYLNGFSWSQADLAREADISVASVARAINGDAISRRNAQSIISALDKKLQAQGAKGHVTLGSVRGLHITDLKRKRRRGSNAQSEEVAADPAPQG
jgi:Helix-turn-helix